MCRPCRLTARKEKPGLLFPQRPADTSSARRRPADLFVPSYLGSPTDLAWLSQPRSRQETLGEAARSGLAAASAYAAVKRMHLDTAQFAKSTGSLSIRSWSKQRVPGRATLRSSSGGLPRPPLLERVGRSTCMGHFSKSFRSLREAPDTAPSCDVAPSSPWPANRLLLCERLLNPE